MPRSGLQRIKQRLTRDNVLSSLRGAILEGAFQPGERLVESDLAEQLGTSRGPVRDALKELAQEGLVVISPYRGAEVATFSPQDIQEICDLRALLEGYAAREAAKKATPRDLERLQEVLDQMQALADGNDLSGLMEKELEFHREICRLSGNTRLFKVWSSLASQIQLLLILTDRMSFDADFIVETHVPVLDAIHNKGPEAAEKAIRLHFRETAATMVQELEHAGVTKEERIKQAVS